MNMTNTKTPAMMASEAYAEIAAEPNAPVIRFYDKAFGMIDVELPETCETFQMKLESIKDAIAYHHYTKLDIRRALWREDMNQTTRSCTPWSLWNGVLERFGDDNINISVDGTKWAKISYDNYSYMVGRVAKSYWRFKDHQTALYIRYRDEAEYYIDKYASGPLDDDRVRRLISLGLAPWKKNGFNRLYLNGNIEGITSFIDATNGLITVCGGTAEQRKMITLALENALAASKSEDATQRAIRAMGMM